MFITYTPYFIFVESFWTNDKKFIENYNASLKELQNCVTEKINALRATFNVYIKERDTVIKDKGDEVRVLKKALVNLHHLNKTLKLPENKTNYQSYVKKYNWDDIILKVLKVYNYVPVYK